MTDSSNHAAHLAKVLVTGATGLVGNNVVRNLRDREIPVRVLIRQDSLPESLSGLDVEYHVGDVRDLSGLQRAIDGASAVVHAAGCILLGWRKADLHEQINHQGTRNVARAAREAGARMLHISSVNALGVGTKDQPADEQSIAGPNIPCPYVTSKQAAERAVQVEIERGLDALIVYPGFMLGPWDWKPSSGRMLLELANKFVPFAPVGGLSVTDVRDVADAMIRALSDAPTGRRYVLAGHNLTYLEIWRRFARVAGRHGPICRAGPLMRHGAGRLGDLWGWITGNEPDLNSAGVKLSECWHYFSSKRAQDELDYQIRPFDQTIQDAWQWLTKHGYR